MTIRCLFRGCDWSKLYDWTCIGKKEITYRCQRCGAMKTESAR